jgi:hypothetical protein
VRFRPAVWGRRSWPSSLDAVLEKFGGDSLGDRGNLERYLEGSGDRLPRRDAGSGKTTVGARS